MELQYNFEQNHDALRGVNESIGALQDVRNDVNQMFSVLMEVYEGDAANALHVKSQQISKMLDQELIEMSDLQRQAQDQQDAMQSLDKANASAF